MSTCLDRREFLKVTAVAGVASGFPTIIPATALDKDGAVAPSEGLGRARVAIPP